MDMLIKGCRIFSDGRFVFSDVEVRGGSVFRIGPNLSAEQGVPVFEFQNCLLLPGLVDVHVHLRDPGFSFKETMRTGTLAAARGGYTAVCAMPNVSPVPDCAVALDMQLQRIREDAVVRVHPYAAITVGERGETLADMEALAANCVAFSDDGHGVQSDERMRAAMLRAKALGKIIAAHCEDNSLLRGGYIHDGAYAKAHGHRGICSESEWRQVDRDLALARETGCAYHVCHVSTKESVALIRAAKAAGVDVTCETAPHYLLLCEDDLQEDGRFKMNPPLRAREDQQALIEGLLDGTIDMIATDHAPHTHEEKARGLEHSAMGVVGLETALAVLHTGLVRTGVLTMEQLTARMSVIPARRFGLPCGIQAGAAADFAVFDPEKQWTIDPEHFASLGKATPFAGREVTGSVEMTVCGGEIIWKAE